MFIIENPAIPVQNRIKKTSKTSFPSKMPPKKVPPKKGGNSLNKKDAKGQINLDGTIVIEYTSSMELPMLPHTMVAFIRPRGNAEAVQEISQIVSDEL